MKTPIMYMIEHIASVPYGHTRGSLEKNCLLKHLTKWICMKFNVIYLNKKEHSMSHFSNEQNQVPWVLLYYNVV